MKTEIKNAKITGYSLGKESHGILTMLVHLEGQGWGCSFGGYGFDSWNEEKQRRIGHAFGCEFISRVLETVGVDDVNKLKGASVRAETEGWGGGIVALGNFLKDDWFNPKELAKEMLEEEHV